jgi:hypothetical protein
MELRIMPLSLMPLDILTLSVVTLSMITLIIKNNCVLSCRVLQLKLRGWGVSFLP